MNRKPEWNCKGCGKAFEPDRFSLYADKPPRCCTVEIAPEVYVDVCEGRAEGYFKHVTDSGRRPSASCIVKAHRAVGKCPGCGVEDVGDIGMICDKCTANIDRGKRAGGDAVAYYPINWDKMFGPYISDGKDKEVIRRLTENLLKAVAGDRRWQKGFPDEQYNGKATIPSPAPNDSYFSVNGGMYFLEMTAAQAEALRAFLYELQQAGEIQYRRGYDDGNDLLGGLASGRTKPGDYEQWAPQGGMAGYGKKNRG